MPRFAALALLLALAALPASPGFAADPVPATTAPAAATVAGVDPYGILIGMLRQIRQSHSQERQLMTGIGQSGAQLRQSTKDPAKLETIIRQQEEKLRGLSQQQEKTARMLADLESDLAKLKKSARPATVVKPSTVRPATTLRAAPVAGGLAPRTPKKIGLTPVPAAGATAPATAPADPAKP